jgi:hypothetical protein
VSVAGIREQAGNVAVTSSLRGRVRATFALPFSQARRLRAEQVAGLLQAGHNGATAAKILLTSHVSVTAES